MDKIHLQKTTVCNADNEEIWKNLLKLEEKFNEIVAWRNKEERIEMGRR